MAAPKLLEHLRQIAPTLSVGAISANMMNIGADLDQVEAAGVQVLHFDVMDGVFCPLLTVGPGFIKGIKTKLLKDVHLMIDAPLEKVADYVKAGADIISVPAEGSNHLHRVLQLLGTLENANDPARGLVRGISLNPGTPLSVIEPVLDDIDMVLLLAVNPGWGGQKFIPATEPRIADTKRIISRTDHDILLCVDGAITRANIGTVVAMGADLIVSGSAIFDGKAPADNARYMLETCKG
jgi:ribulose-phosphate 3-epimerase